MTQNNNTYQLYETKEFVLEVFDDEMIELSLKQGIHFNEYLLGRITYAMKLFAKSHKYKLMIQGENHFSVSVGTRKVLSAKWCQRYISAVSFYTTHDSLHMMTDFYLQANTPSVPVGLFRSREEALDWLMNNKGMSAGSSALKTREPQFMYN